LQMVVQVCSMHMYMYIYRHMIGDYTP
jgi:hypothetical protein